MKEKRQKKNNNNDSKLKEGKEKNFIGVPRYSFALKGSNLAYAWLREVLLFLGLDQTASCDSQARKKINKCHLHVNRNC